MQEDLAALKKGQAPAGFQIEKESEKEVKAPALQAMPARPTLSPTLPHVELGKLEKSKPLTGSGMPSIPWPTKQEKPMAIPTPPGLNPLKPSMDIPSTAGIMGKLGRLGSKKMLLWGGIGLVVVIAVVLIFTLIPSEPEVTFSPTPSAIVTPTPPARPFIEDAFTLYSSVNIGVGQDVFTQLLSLVNQDVLAGGEPGLYKIIDPQSGQHYSFDSFMSSALVIVPEEIKPFVDKDGVYLSLMQKVAGGHSYGFTVKLDIAESDSLAVNPVIAALGRWETNISTNIKNLFALDIDKAASVDFADNTYQGVAIRYRNFPDPLKTMDYAVVTAANGDKYLVFTNSREHMYAMIDNLR